MFCPHIAHRGRYLSLANKCVVQQAVRFRTSYSTEMLRITVKRYVYIPNKNYVVSNNSIRRRVDFLFLVVEPQPLRQTTADKHNVRITVSVHPCNALRGVSLAKNVNLLEKSLRTRQGNTDLDYSLYTHKYYMSQAVCSGAQTWVCSVYYNPQTFPTLYRCQVFPSLCPNKWKS